MTLFQLSTDIKVSSVELLFPEARQRRESAQASRSMVRVQEPLASSGGHCNIEHEYTSVIVIVMVLLCYCWCRCGPGSSSRTEEMLPPASTQQPRSCAGVTALRASTPRHGGVCRYVDVNM